MTEKFFLFFHLHLNIFEEPELSESRSTGNTLALPLDVKLSKPQKSYGRASETDSFLYIDDVTADRSSRMNAGVHGLYYLLSQIVQNLCR